MIFAHFIYYVKNGITYSEERIVTCLGLKTQCVGLGLGLTCYWQNNDLGYPCLTYPCQIALHQRVLFDDA